MHFAIKLSIPPRLLLLVSMVVTMLILANLPGPIKSKRRPHKGRFFAAPISARAMN